MRRECWQLFRRNCRRSDVKLSYLLSRGACSLWLLLRAATAVVNQQVSGDGWQRRRTSDCIPDGRLRQPQLRARWRRQLFHQSLSTDALQHHGLSVCLSVCLSCQGCLSSLSHCTKFPVPPSRSPLYFRCSSPLPRPDKINCFKIIGVHALRLISRTAKRVWRVLYNLWPLSGYGVVMVAKCARLS